MIGTKLSHYLILERLGEGGMGVVYRARDERLERDVAIKVLPKGALADDPARRRFRQEALALSRLNHPNIETIYEFDSQQGVDFLVLELVAGETLSERIRRGSLPGKDVVLLGTQLAEGLSAAHRAGVVHRDVKPGNLRVTPEGRLKILDFGLARRMPTGGDVGATVTDTGAGAVSGTAPYMAPEQLRGEKLDERTDIWAAGASLYELATGKRPFEQQSLPLLIQAILHQAPPSLRDQGADVPRDLERILVRCLEKDPDHRYQTARDLAADLKRILRDGEGQAALRGGARRGSRRKPRLVAGAVAVAVVAAGVSLALGVGGLRERFFPVRKAAAMSLAVLPLANLSGDPRQEFFADGMTDELISTLSQVGAMRVISRTSSMQYKGSRKPLREIARELGVRMVVEGSVLRAGSGVRITAQLVDALADRALWSESYERDARDVLRLQSDVARSIVDRIAVKLTPRESGRLAAAPRVDPEAHEAYLRGRQDYNEFLIDGFRKAVGEFDRAVEIDPEYAPAYAGLADAYCALSSVFLPASEAMPRARAAASKALEIDPDLAGAHEAMAYVDAFYDWNWAAGEKGFRRAIALNPNEVTAHQFLAQLLMFSGGRFREAGAEIRTARALDPLSPFLTAMSVWPLYLDRRFSEAASLARTLLAADSTNASLHYSLGISLTMTGLSREGLAEFEQAYARDARPNYLCWVGWARARMGDRAGATDVLRQLRDLSSTTYVQPYTIAMLYAGLGEADSAFTYLERGVALRSEEQVEIRNSVAMDPLRGDPRFQAILRRMNLAF